MLSKKLSKIKRCLLDLIFPVQCLGCGRSDSYLCPHCLESILLIDYFVCPVCRRPSTNGQTCPRCQSKTKLDGLIYALNYDQPLVRQAVHAIKYSFIQDLMPIMANLLIKVLDQSCFHQDFRADAVIPIPLHRQKLAQRGFNQAELLAEILGRKYSWKIDNKVLQRTRSTRSQTELPRLKRLANVKNIFRVRTPESIKNKNIILVDDVCTTGATLEEATKILKQHGAAKIWAITLARGER
ncbi:MAG: ComF family protein [Candidatus Parcubacteria bacterium]|nr:ComF family protein [Candidatus Parcubacteria bacterium]